MRINKTFTVTANGAINLVTGADAVAMVTYGAVPRTMVRALIIQMKHGGTGLGYVMDGIYGVQAADGVSPRIPSAATDSDVTAELAPATATAPGGSYTDFFELPNGAAGTDVSRMWVDGAVPGDKIKVSYDTIEP